MAPLPYPHRATFLATTLIVSAEQRAIAPYAARLISVVVFDHLVRHPVVTLGDHDDERLTDDAGQLLDAAHPQLEDSIDWFFRISRRHEVLWFELGLDPTRPRPAVLRSRRPAAADAVAAAAPAPATASAVDEWAASAGLALSQQLDHCLASWLGARRLPAVGALPAFTLDDLRDLAERLVQVDELIVQGRELGIVPRSLTQPPAQLPVAFLRVLAELSPGDARLIDPAILQLDPAHPVARRNRLAAAVVAGDAERRAILPLVAEAPMYGRPHLSVWGEPFAADRPLEGMAVRHQGIAASLMPANPYACHNYSLQLAEAGRREESYRWADRATVAAPRLGAAHLDCVRRLRQIGRPGQAFAEAQYRCREILDRAAAGKLSGSDWQAPHQARLLIALVHLDIGRIAEAIELAEQVLAELPGDPDRREAFAWAARRIAHWKEDPAAFARACAREGHHRGDVARVLAGLGCGPPSDDVDAMMLIDALCTIGRADQAETAYWQCAGLDGGAVLGDGKARLAAARALILTGELDEALDQLQIVQLRRGQSRLEAEINRLLRLAAIWPARAWDRVIERRLARGQATLARLAARDLADFIPGLDPEVVRRALGDQRPLAIDPLWIAELIAAVPAAQGSSPEIVARLARPADATLAAADALAAEWWTALVPAARDRDAHAAGAVLALGLALANYLVAASGPPSPIAGAYRHIATEALQLVRRARYQLETPAITGLLRMLDWLGDAPEWLLDPWLLRVERALDLEAEHGAYLGGVIAGMPVVQRLLRGDERIGWELRLAHDLAADPSQYEAAATLFARSARAVEAGGALRAWSSAAAATAPGAAPGAAVDEALDVHWTAALAHPTGVAAPWLALARGLLAAGRREDGFAAACRGIAATPVKDRARALAELAPLWAAAEIAVPLHGVEAFELGIAAAADGALDLAAPHLRWAVAVDPSNARRAHALAATLARLGRGREALHALAHHDRDGAPRQVGRILLESGHTDEAVRALSYAARWFRAPEDWATLARAAHRAGDHALAASAGRRAVALGAGDPELLIALAASVRHLGDAELSSERRACDDLEAGKFDALIAAVSSPSWGIARVALAACEVRHEDEGGIPVSPRALDAALAILARSAGATEPEAVLARIRALRIRDNAFIQIDPPPPLGLYITPEQFEHGLAERTERRRADGTAAGTAS